MIEKISTVEISILDDEVKTKKAEEQEKNSVFDDVNATNLLEIQEEDEVEDVKNEKITFKEGLKLFGEGALNKVKKMGTAIIKHPLKTVAVVGATTAAIAALPLIGISAATGAAAAALVFGGIAIGKTAVDVVETVDDYQDGRYDEVREDLQELGGDGVDLALSLPFMPKAIKQVSRTVKYGTSTIGLNKELISGLKSASSADDVIREFGKANAKITYEQIGNEMGLKVKPELEFSKDMDGLLGEFDEVTGKTYYNENAFSLKSKEFQNRIKINKSVENTLRHELQHFEQYKSIAMTQGNEGLKNAIVKQYSSSPITDFSEESLLRMGAPKYAAKRVANMMVGDKTMFNQSFWDDVVKNNGGISSNADDIANAQKYLQSFIDKASGKVGYFDSLVESEASGAGNAYQIIGPKEIIADEVMAVAAAENTFSEDDENILEVAFAGVTHPSIAGKLKKEIAEKIEK